MTRQLRIVVAAAIALLVAGAGGFLASRLPGPALQAARSLGATIGGPFTLTATDGRTVTEQTYRGKWVLIYFGYTACTDACPLALNDMGVALQQLGGAAAALQPLFITFDPKHDTREKLSQYLKSLDPRIVGLTGSRDQIAAVVKEYRVYVEEHLGDGGHDDQVDHSSFFYLVNPDGKFLRVLSGELSGDEIAQQLGQLIKRTA